MSRFNDIMRAADAVLDDHIAEPAYVEPRADGEIDSGLDPNRASFECVGLPADFEESSAQIASMTTRVTYAELEFSIRWEQLPDGFRFRKGDVVKLTERRNPWHKVNRVEKTDAQRVVIVLTEVTGT